MKVVNLTGFTVYINFIGSDSISGGKHAVRNPSRHMPSF